jgi:predicted lactoylglutathione lyase
MANVEVRIRHESQPEGVVLGEVPFRKEAIDAIIPTIQAWGLSFMDNTVDENSIYGQFFADQNRAYFEVMIPQRD